jgi:WD40 repeat protein
MLPPDFTIHNRYRVIYLVDDRPGSKVYRARDEQTGRLVLVAELPCEDETGCEDMELLARQIASLQHEVLIPLADHFAVGDTYYLVCVDPGGQDFERALRARGGPLPESEALAQGMRLLEALEYLHHQRPPIYLGDPYPGDLWIGEDGAWRLTPFTLARPIGHVPSPYRAPELTEKDAEPTAPGDLYAISALLYHALTGWAPPTAEQQKAGTPLTGPRVLNPTLSALAEQALLRGLQQRPVNRYQAAREMRLAIETVQMMGGRSLGLGPDVLTTVPPQGSAAPAPTPAPLPAPAPAAPAGAPMPPPPPGVYPAPAGSYPPPAQLYPTGIYPAPPKQRRLSTGCLVALAVILTLLAVGICIGLLLLLPGSPLGGLLGVRGIALFATPIPSPTAAPTAGPAGVATSVPLPTPAPANLGPRAITLQNAGTITQTREITTAVLGPVAYAPDGTTLAVGVSSVIHLLDASTLEDRRQLQGHVGQISSLAWSPDSKLLASGGIDETVVRLWDPTTGQLVRELTGHTGGIRSLAWSPDGAQLASGSIDTTIRVWNVADGRLLLTLKGHTDFVGGVDFSPDGKTLVSGSRDGTVRLWDLTTGQQHEGFTFEAPIDPGTGTRYWTTGVDFSPDGTLLAVGSTSGLIYILDPNTGEERQRLSGHTSLIVIRGVLFAPDGRSLATASLDGSIRLWNPATGTEIARLGGEGQPGHSLQILAISFSPDGQHIASASDEEGQLLIWDVPGRRIADSRRVGQGLITGLAFSPDSNTLGTVGYNGTIRMYPLNGREGISLIGSASALQVLAFLTNDRVVAISDQGTIEVVSAGEEATTQLSGLDGNPLNVVASGDGRVIAAGSNSGAIGVWDAATGNARPTLRSDLGTIYRLALNDDGSLLAAAGPPSDPRIEIWDVATGQRIHTLADSQGGITGLAFQPRGMLLAAADFDGSLRLWNARNGQLAHRIPATQDQERFTALAFAPDGTMLATASPNGEVRFWNVGTGEAVAQMTITDASPLALEFSPDGEKFAVSLRDKTVRIFELPRE